MNILRRIPFFQKKSEDSISQAARVPPGVRVYAIGDVHGRFDLLYGLLARIRAESRGRPAAETHIVMLGDLVDRGPQSAQVLEYLRGRTADFAEFHFVMGNHEEAMLAALDPDGNPEMTGWLEYGGRQTMQSYGAPEWIYDELEGPALARAMLGYVPSTHLRFLETFVDNVAFGDYLFVHAGIRPGVATPEQSSQDMRWIREPFLSDDRLHGCVVVHGHTISEGPEIRASRIGIDTGAYRTGVLTSIGLHDDDRWFLSVSARE